MEEEEDQEEEDVTKETLLRRWRRRVISGGPSAGRGGQYVEGLRGGPRRRRHRKEITCHYEFRSSDSKGTAEGGEATFREDLVHHYLLPEDLVLLLDRCGFEIRELHGISMAPRSIRKRASTWSSSLRKS